MFDYKKETQNFLKVIALDRKLDVKNLIALRSGWDDKVFLRINLIWGVVWILGNVRG